MHYETALTTIYDEIKTAAGRTLYDWIDGPGDMGDGLDDREDLGTESLYTVTVAVPTDSLTATEARRIDKQLRGVASEYGIAIDLVGNNTDGWEEYQFSLHSLFARPPKFHDEPAPA